MSKGFRFGALCSQRQGHFAPSHAESSVFFATAAGCSCNSAFWKNQTQTLRNIYTLISCRISSRIAFRIWTEYKLCNVMSDQCSWVLSLGRSRAHFHLCPSLVFCSLKISVSSTRRKAAPSPVTMSVVVNNFSLMNTEEKFCHFDGSQWVSTG